MQFWPFGRKEPTPATPEQLRDLLLNAVAAGSRKRLKSLCNQFKAMVADNVDVFATVPLEHRADPGRLDGYIQSVGAIAMCLAQECNAPELWNRLCGNGENNPLVRWDGWRAQLSERAQRLEYEALIAESKQLIQETLSLQGNGARQNEALFTGCLGSLLFQSGDVAGSIPVFESVLAMCREQADVEGQQTYLNLLMDAHRYLGQIPDAIRAGEEAIQLAADHGLECAALRHQVRQLHRGEPLCRIVVVRDGLDIELDEVVPELNVTLQFHFRRNRPSLGKANTLVQMGNKLAGAGKHSEAAIHYQHAMAVDPFDPDPVYQFGMCQLESKNYGEAREAYDKVEQLAPGWFHCRFDRWLAEGLENGSIDYMEFQAHRVLQDGGLAPASALPLAVAAVDRFPAFAPLYLLLGDLHVRNGSEDEGIALYRKGLELTSEPDLESRLLCALAGKLTVDSPERRSLVDRALGLKGSLLSQAIAALIPRC